MEESVHRPQRVLPVPIWAEERTRRGPRPHARPYESPVGLLGEALSRVRQLTSVGSCWGREPHRWPSARDSPPSDCRRREPSGPARRSLSGDLSRSLRRRVRETIPWVDYCNLVPDILTYQRGKLLIPIIQLTGSDGVRQLSVLLEAK